LENSEKTGTTITSRVSGRPVVAIVGRQNVGKSTLLNRIIKKRLAITSEIPGTTRDRIMVEVSWKDVPFMVIDTGGLPPKKETEVDNAVIAQVDEAILDADVILFLVDVKDRVTPYDEEIARRLHRTGKPVILAINKVDNDKLLADAAEFYRLGLGESSTLSAYHNDGVEELMDRIVSLLPQVDASSEETAPGLKIAIVGRPAVGKSMLLNALLGEERAIVTGKPGTTRDTIDSPIDFQGQNMLLIDTAGIRRRGSVLPGVERYSVIRSMEAIDRADIALLVLDATEPATAQDTHIAGYIADAMKGIILLVNKWDLIDASAEEDYVRRIREDFIFVPYTPIIFISAKTRFGLDKILPEAVTVSQERQKRVPPEELKEMLATALAAHVPPHTGKKQLKIYSVSQTGINQPAFTFHANDQLLLHFSYRRYLENQLRTAFSFEGTAVKLEFKAARR
jgi:GTP-binding protein